MNPEAVTSATISTSTRWARLCERLRLSPLELRIFLVAAVGFVPLAALSFINLLDTGVQQRDRLLRASEEIMRAVISAVDAEHESAIAALDVLAASPRLANGDFAGLYVEARELLRRRRGWMNVVVSLPDARQVMNARLPVDAPLPEAIDPESTAQTVRTGRPVIGNLIYSPVLEAHGFAVQVPYKRDGRVEYVLSAIVRPDALLEFLKRQRVHEQGVMAILDRNYRLVARLPDHERWIGKPPPKEVIELLDTGVDTGWTKTTSNDGVPHYAVVQRSSFSGWVAGIGMPRGVIDAPIYRSYLVLGGAIMLSVLAGLVGALLIGHTIIGPMRELQESASRVGRDEPPLTPNTKIPEIRRIATALATAHAERQRLFALEHEARVAAERASRAKDEFLAMLGHELRNPLAAITTATHLLERKQQVLDPDMVHATEIISRQARHLARLTDDLLDAGRVILGKIVLVRSPLDLGAAVRSVLQGLEESGRLARHIVTCQIESVWIEADPIRIDQIVGNLLTNALKYTPEGGSIDISVREQDGCAVLQIRDTGIGIDAELLPRVFELFVQGERSLDRAQGGLGIGLTLVRRLTELHGGTIEAYSAGVNRGATFTVRMPTTQARPRQPSASAAVAVQPLIIAIVEDNEDLRSSLRASLMLEGHEVYEAVDGVAGLELICSTPDLDGAIIDIGLPLMDGYEVARAVRQRRKDIRLIAMTGYGAAADEGRALEAGFDAYLVKPIDPAELHRTLAACRPADLTTRS